MPKTADVAREIVAKHRNCFTPVCPIEGEIAAALTAARDEALEEGAVKGMAAVLKTSCATDSHCQVVAELFAQTLRDLKSAKQGDAS